MTPNSTPNAPQNPVSLNGTSHQNGAPAPVATNVATNPVAASNAERRLASQRRERTASLNLTGRESDPLSRLRDKWGNPIGRLHVGVIPAMPDDKKVEETRLARVFELLQETMPIRANKLARDYDHVVREQLVRLREMVRQAKDELNAFNAEIVRRNQALEARKAELEMQRDGATETDRNAVVALDSPLAQAHQAAAEKVALAGGAYEPQNPAAECVLRHTCQPLLVLAGEHGLPYDESDAHWSDTASQVANVLTGILFGTSLAILPGIVDADELKSGQTSTIIVWALFAAIGWAITHKAGEFLAGWARDVSERYWLGRPASEWGKVLAVTIIKAVAVYFVWTVVDSKGLMKLAELNGATGAGGHQMGALATWALGSVVSLAFVGAAITKGAYKGRYLGVRNRLLGLQEAAFQLLDEKIRACPLVQAALNAIARVQELTREKAMLETRVVQVAAPFNEEITRLEAEKEEPCDDVSPDVKTRLQDAFDDWHIANSAWERQLDDAIEQAEPGSGVWRRLLRTLCGYPRPQGRNREKRRRP